MLCRPKQYHIVIKKSRKNGIRDTTIDNICSTSFHPSTNLDKNIETEKFTKLIDKPIKVNNYKNNLSRYSGSRFKSFIMADKMDLQIIKELLMDPSIQTFEISFKLGIPLGIIHKKRRLIENTVLKKRFLIDFRKLGLEFRFADVFAHIQKDKVKNFVKELFKTTFSKNILEIMTIKGGSDSICIKTMYQDTKELFFLMDEIRSRPFISNVHFSEEIEVFKDNNLTMLLDILDGNR